MKYCMNYNQITFKNKYIQEADEWTITYNPKDTTLLEFLDINQNRRINIFIEEPLEDYTLFNEICKKYSNVYLKLSNLDAEVPKGLDSEARFFFDIKTTNWNLVMKQLDAGVTDIYIAADLGFDLERLNEVIDREKVQLRVFPNLAQSLYAEQDGLLKFFIRPEDIDFYSDYVDIVEFYEVDDKLDIYYKIYAKDKKWFGDLAEIIIDLTGDKLDNKYMIDGFAETRVRCEQRCIKGGKCRKCYRIRDLANTLEKADLILKVQKEENEGEKNNG